MRWDFLYFKLTFYHNYCVRLGLFTSYKSKANKKNRFNPNHLLSSTQKVKETMKQSIGVVLNITGEYTKLISNIKSIWINISIWKLIAWT